MKGTALLLLCAVTLAQANIPQLTLRGKVCNCNPEEAPNVCSQNGSDDELVVHENCNQFYQCNNGLPVASCCPAGLVYNPYDERCDWPYNVDCGDRPIVECEGGNGDNESGGEGDNDSGDNSGTCNCDPGEAPAICGTAGSEGVLVAHENCNQLYMCSGGAPVTICCPEGLVYNPYDERCDWPESVDCGGKPIVKCEEGNGENESEEDSDSGGGDNGGTCNCSPEEAPTICSTAGSDGVLVAHENCNQFYKCDDGTPIALWCPAGLVYNPYNEQCDWPANVDCGNRPIVECEEGNGDNNSTCNCDPEEVIDICGAAGSDGILVAHENCNQFYKCYEGAPITLCCSAGLVFNPYSERCDWPNNVDCGGKPIVECEGNGDNGSGGDGDGGDGDNGDGDNGDGDNGGGDNGEGENGGTCNCNPEEAPGICGTPGSDGVLVAHENCNQFYKCDDGAPVALCCPAGLQYNPYDQRCDWADNVDCGSKPVVECEEGNGDNGSEGDGDSNGGDNGEGENGGTCNCNPEEAPGICGTPGSDGVLVAHENCNQFYKCDDGVPVALCCPAGLLYNPYNKWCDWADNVDCGGKPVVECEEGNGDNGSGGDGDSGSGDNGDGGNGDGDNGGTCNCNPEEAPDICGTAGSDGVLVAHENCNKFYKCDDGVPIALCCPAGLLFNPYHEWCDWPNNVDCGGKPIVECEGNGDNGSGGDGDSDDGDNGDGENGGTCNCNPEEAPGICGTAGSNGVLVAHENCNQFYKCDDGSPVALCCPAGLVYNPYIDCCDWPDNVNCGGKPIVECESSGDNGSGGDGDTDSGDNGDGENGGTCNCNPEEAPGICGAAGSDGVLVAHENCNQFYKCDDGVPVALCCPAGLLFNPYHEWCDWPNNVDCGGKPTVECEGNGDNGSGGDGDGGDGDNGDGENGGTCNCNPEEAPGICGTAGSNGVLVAHENCNQFYKCDDGSPVALCCPAGLVYNPYIDCCDWPDNVDCGGKPIVECESSGDNGSGGDGDTDSGDNGDGENGGTCNCNPEEAPGICGAAGSDGVLVAHENCNQFYKCDDGVPVALCCPAGLLFNPYHEWCDWPNNVDCGGKPTVECEGNGDNGSGGDGDGGDGDNGDGENGGTCNCNPEEAPGICGTAGSNGVLVAHENCNQFYKCDDGSPVALCCPAGLVYNPYIDCCDWPDNVDCGGKPIVECESSGDNGSGGDGDTDSGDNGDGDNGGTCNCNPEEAPGICGAAGSDGVLVAHENCNQFYKCDDGVPVALCCPAGLLFNPYHEWCDWPNNVDCGSKPTVECEGNGDNGSEGEGDSGDGDNGDGENGGTCNCIPEEAPGICGTAGSNGVLVAHENCNQFYKCDDGSPVALCCPAGLVYNPYINCCDWPDNVDCGGKPIVECESSGDNGNGGDIDNGGVDNGDGENGGTCNCNPEEAPGICSTAGSDGVLVAHENCNQFYKCNDGLPVALCCPAGLLYNPYNEWCDWPNNVDCGSKPTVECEGNGDNGSGGDGDSGSGDNGDGDNGDGENGGTCNCNPEEAPGICGAAGSDGVLVAHENCNQFYKCSEGLPVALCCPAGLLYNPYNEWCDWPNNVDCGGKPTVECEGNGDNGSGGDGDSGSGDNGDGENGGTCNCNPEEAPGICGAAGSDGVLVAHENCNQFYKCSDGLPVALCCPAGLLYNPYNKWCDWADNVDCGGKPVVECEEGNGDNGSGGGGDSGSGDNGDGDNGGTCNCNPEEAPGICGAAGSDGVLVAHENCNQFYKCSEGLPVALCCPAGLLYNPYNEWCDWPNNVDCGSKPTVECEGNGDNGSGGDGDSGSGDNGDGDNGDGENGGTCNCNPEEAPGICGTAGSDGVLVAHENCNQFYKCSDGLPVVLCCPAGLLYNPYNKWCDWADNVDCGGKPVVECEEGNGDNGSGGDGDSGCGDNGDGDNGDGDNGGTCNCNPEEAPGICGAAGSDGVLVAHENCNQFYKCSDGLPVALCCPAGLLYNPYNKWCDWADNVDCGGKPVVECEEGNGDNGSGGDGDSGSGDNGDGDNGGTCNCNPEEAPGICSAVDSDGVLVAHENCNQFYKCDDGAPVALWCPAGLVYNPFDKLCDWPANVDCGDKPNVENETENGDGDSGGDTGSSEISCEDNNSPSNPELAPEICSSGESDGTLIAHENCNQFYMCSHGTSVILTCQPGLVYNPAISFCDWPANVADEKCGEKPIEEVPTICSASGSDGLLIAHENCNMSYICVEGVLVALECPENQLFNTERQTCDFAWNVDCGDRVIPDGNTVGGGGNCDPSEAPAICVSANSNGVLVAHENCDQFYVCAYGKPVALDCPANLLYNPDSEECDWPRNVDCGDRIIPEPDSGSNDGSCSCDAREATSICARAEANGKLIAHENCNQYYVCFEGTPVARSCPHSLFYEPHTEQCLRPQSVDCEGRTVATSYESLNKQVQARRGFF